MSNCKLYEKKNQETWSIKVKKRGLNRLGHLRLNEATPITRPFSALLRPCKFLPGRPNYLKLPLANINYENKNSENTLDMIGYLEHLRADRKTRR